ncbi:hypothetical protein BGZ83_011477 [Gryganskiella cystojenkinii]|nr:hypothetical protein BGZ83_011477 [Gryganskiella cystojenkinii]
MEDIEHESSEGCYCLQGRRCPHWKAASFTKNQPYLNNNEVQFRGNSDGNGPLLAPAASPSSSSSSFTTTAPTSPSSPSTTPSSPSSSTPATNVWTSTRRLGSRPDPALSSPYSFMGIPRSIDNNDHRPLVNELQRELRLAMLEIEKMTTVSRDMAKLNQDLEESRLVAVSEQARTAKRLLLMTSQLEYTEQKLFKLSQEVDDGLKDSDLLRIERIKREALQEREDASRLKIESLQDELQELQRSERTLQQKLLTTQTKYETLGKRHDLLRRQQQESDMARESKEAVAWLKETTNRLMAPPEGSLGQVIQQEKAQLGSGLITAPIPITQSAPSTSPPYLSSIMEPPLAAQNQMIGLIKELATTNSTLRSELTEYRDLLQDARNEVISLRAQVEDYEQGHAYDCCGGSSGVQDDNSSDGYHVSKGTWGNLDPALIAMDPVLQQQQNIKDGIPISGSPPPYMTSSPAPATLQHQHLHHHIHLPGVRGNIFGELDRLYSQNHPPPIPSSRHKSKGHSSSRMESSRRSGKESSSRRHHHDHHHSSKHPIPADLKPSAATVSTSTSTSEARREVGVQPLAPKKITSSQRSGPGDYGSGSSSNRRVPINQDGNSKLEPGRRQRSRKSLYTDVDMDMLDSEGSDHEQERLQDGGGNGRGIRATGPSRRDEEKRYVVEDDDDNDYVDPEMLSEFENSGSDHEPGFIAQFAETLSFLSFFSGPVQGSPP